MKTLKTLVAVALLCATSWTSTFAASGNVDPILQAAADQAAISYEELARQIETGEASITETDDGVVEVQFRAVDGGGMVIIGILDNF